ncbi:MAG: Ig-like domain-containing protein [Planctomycetota bacterium]|jgi:filamentous hemagglutinin family protein
MMESVKRNRKRAKWRRYIGCLLTCCVLLNATVQVAPALESGDLDPLAGSSGATFTQWGDHTIIDTDHGAIINWDNFNTGTDQIVQFRQFMEGVESNMSAVLNRINSGAITEFKGALNANGRVFVVNPAGILFANGSTVNVAQLVASGLGMTDDAFQAVLENPDNTMAFGGGNGTVDVRGTVDATDSVHLVGKKVRTIAGVRAPGGLIVIAAGDRAYIAQDGSNVLVELDADPGGDPVDVDVRSLLSVRDGDIVLAASDQFGRTIRNVGTILATRGGTVTARAARIEQRGPIHVSGDPSKDSDGGTVTLTGTEEVVLGEDSLGIPSSIIADAGINGTGGNIIIESEGTVTFEQSTIPHRSGGSEDIVISAAGGAESGDGGYVKITGEHFSIAPGTQIDASPHNTDSSPGTLEIDPPTVTIADGPGAGAADTLYEEDIETLSNNGTSVIVRADDSIVVEDIDDNEIDGRYGGIELHATGPDGSVSFADSADKISTTLGDIAITAGSGGINIGSLETARDSSDNKPTPGKITLNTANGGDITAENLAIISGWGRSEITADSSGSLTINGDVTVGVPSQIQTIPNGANGEALITLSAADNVVLNGNVTAETHGTDDAIAGGVTRSYIGIFGGTDHTGDGSVTINGDVVARARSASNGTSEATIEINAWGDINFGPSAAAPLALADNGTGGASVQSYESAEDTSPTGDVARIIIDTSLLEALPDFGEGHMGNVITGNVRDNDIVSQGLPEDITIALDGDPAHGSLTLNADGSYVYTPEPGFVGTDTFTYVASAHGDTTAPIVVTITVTNTLPVINNDVATTYENTRVTGNVLANDLDPDSDPLAAALISGPGNGSLTLNPDGSYSYTPAPGFIGEDTFTYSAGDPEVGATPGQATVTITVNEQLTTAPPPAPGVDVRMEPQISGTPALIKWVAEEIGTKERAVDVWFANTLASARDISPIESYANFKKAAKVLQDRRGIHADALAQVISEFASSTLPPSEEQMASIADAIALNTESNSVYARAGSYLDSLAAYVAFLVDEMGFTPDDAIEFVTTKYVDRLASREDVNVVTYIAARLAGLYNDTID